MRIHKFSTSMQTGKFNLFFENSGFFIGVVRQSEAIGKGLCRVGWFLFGAYVVY